MLNTSRRELNDDWEASERLAWEAPSIYNVAAWEGGPPRGWGGGLATPLRMRRPSPIYFR